MQLQLHCFILLCANKAGMYNPPETSQLADQIACGCGHSQRQHRSRPALCWSQKESQKNINTPLMATGVSHFWLQSRLDVLLTVCANRQQAEEDAIAIKAIYGQAQFLSAFSLHIAVKCTDKAGQQTIEIARDHIQHHVKR